ncbi:YkvA family protein [Sporomusa aerivorans]|uniref:YkvA family protein n=1 Tax=Sporomusa aerivorans TaxID=204936 RepID=UPI00352A337F
MEEEKIKESQLTLNQRLKQWARKLKNEIVTMYFVIKHPETPLYAKVLAAIIVGYALSPIDLIPDFVPILGWVDDVILLPLGIALVIKMILAKILEACREEATTNPPTIKPKIWVAAYVVVMLWFMILYSLYEWFK